MRDLLTSIQPEDVSNRSVLPTKAAYFYSTFLALRNLDSIQMTDTRRDNLAAKRQEKRSQDSITMPPLTSQIQPVWVGPPAPPQTEQEARRVMSISDPSQSKAGSKVYYACQEVESQMLGNLFCAATITVLFGDEAALSWVKGRSEPHVLEWRSRYLSIVTALTVVPLPRKSNWAPSE